MDFQKGHLKCPLKYKCILILNNYALNASFSFQTNDELSYDLVPFSGVEWNASVVKVILQHFARLPYLVRSLHGTNIYVGHKKQGSDRCGSTIQSTNCEATALVSKMMLMEYFISIFKELNQRGVFSGPANLSRLKTQLALEASKR